MIGYQTFHVAYKCSVIGDQTYHITLTPGGGCEGSIFGSVCLSVCLSVHTRNTKNIAQIDLILFTQEVLYLCLSPPLRLSRSGLKNLVKDSSPLRDRTK